MDIYVPTGVVDENGKFSDKQIKERLEIGANSVQIIIPFSDEKLLGQLQKWMSGEAKPYLQKFDRRSLKISVHERNDLYTPGGNAKEDWSGLELLRAMDVDTLIVHGGKIYEYSHFLDKAGICETYDTCDYGLDTYKSAIRACTGRLNTLSEQMGKYGIKVLLENMPSMDYFYAGAGVSVDKRWRGWLPQTTDVGWFPVTAKQHKAMAVAGKAGICFDVEHSLFTCEDTAEYLPENFSVVPSEDERRMLEEYDFMVRKGFPKIFKRKLDVVPQIGEAGKIEVAHIAGTVSKFITDGEARRIGSHMPITPNNLFIENPENRSAWWSVLESTLPAYLAALKSAGCEIIVPEVHVGAFSGSEWKSYMKESIKYLVEFGA